MPLLVVRSLLSPRLRTILVAALLLSSLTPGATTAQVPGVIPIGDPAYRELDRLVVAGVIQGGMDGLRPYSRQRFAVLVRDARRNAVARYGAALPPAWRQSLDALSERIDDGAVRPPQRGLVDHIDLTAVTTDATPRLAPSDSGLGALDAAVAPLAMDAQPGRDTFRGTTVILETLHHFSLGTRFEAIAEPRLRLASAPSFTGERTFDVRTLAAHLRIGDALLTAGRDRMVWGQSRHAALFLAANALPLDLVRLETDEPFTFPGPLSALGAQSVSFFVADLGPRQRFPHTRLIGYKWSAQPGANTEIAATVLDFTGGRGAPGATFGKRIENLFLFPVLPTEGFQFSNEMAGIEARLRVPPLDGAQLYWEMNLDDFDFHRIRSSVWTDDGAHVFGLVLPRLDAAASLSATIEAHHTGTRFARHLQFVSGPTVNRFPLADPLGPNAAAEYLYLDWCPRPGASVGLELAHEVYRDDQHTITQPPFTIHLVERRPEERRQRALVTWTRPANASASLTVQAGVEHVANFDFAAGRPQDAALAAVRWSWTVR